jgi:hypothetical protein
MNKLRSIQTGLGSNRSALKTVLAFVPGAALSICLWLASLPLAQALASTPVSPGTSPVSPDQEKCIVCHNNHEISIPCSETDKYLTDHPGDTRGGCQATPVTNP